MLVRPGWPGLVIVIVTELALIFCCSMFGPGSATYRLQATDDGLVSRVLTAWSVAGTVIRAGFIALWGVLASLTSPRWALGLAGVLLLATPLLLPRRVDDSAGRERVAAAAGS